MTQIVHVSRLNPKTTEQDFERFCTRFGTVIECTIYPENEKLGKRSGYVKFTSNQSAEKMYQQSRQETLYIDQTSINVELHHEKNKQNLKKSSIIYTLNIQGQIKDENELINYLNSKPLSIKFIETNDDFGQIIKTGAQVTFNDKDLVEKILKQNHEKYTIKLISNNSPITKRVHDHEQQSIDNKRSKSSQNSYSLLTSHIESINKLTNNIYKENEALKNENSLLSITLNQQLTKIKQFESEKSEFESFIQATKTEIQRLTNHIKILEQQIEQLTTKNSQSELKYITQQNYIELFFSALKQIE